jgi:hypothetical protein
MKKIIRLTENDLHRIVKESVKKIISETNLSNRQIKNITGIYDDDELNAACMSEEAEDIGSNIAKDICNKYGFHSIYDKNAVLDFGFLKDLLEQKYGMKYLGFDENDESHLFGNDNFIVEIWSKEDYPRLAQFHLQNMHVNSR